MIFIHHRTKGLIFKKEDRGEADQLFIIYTKDFGRLEVLGKGIRKISSKLRSGADIFYLSEIEFIQGKTHKTLTDAILIEKFQNIREDSETLKIVYRISEVLDNLIKGEEKDEKIWQLLNEVFQRLNNLSAIGKQKSGIFNIKLIYYYFLWNLLSILGYQPDLYSCPVCQKKLKPEELYFSQKEKGIICHDCFKKINSGEKIDLETIKILRIFIEKKWEVLSKLKVDEKNLKNLESFSENYLSSITGSNN